MIDSTTDLANPGAYGPSDPGGGAHSTQWSFDLDEAVVSGKDAAYIDDARSGATGVSNERNLDARREGFVRTESDDIDAHAISGGKYKAVALSETVTATDGVRDMDFAASQNNAIISAIAVFQEDTLIFREDALIG